MRKILEGSLIFRALSAAAAWLDRQWSRSFISGLFVGGPLRGRDGGILGGLTRRVHLLLARLFAALRLDRLLDGSVFRRQYFWMALTVTAAPVLPTMAVLALAVIATGSVILNYCCDGERQNAATPLAKWIGAFAAVYLGSTLFSVDLRGSLLGGLLTSFFALFALVVADNCRTREDIRRLMAWMTASGAAVALIGIAQAALGLESTGAWVDSGDFSNITLRVWSTLDNPNVLSEYFMLAIPVSACAAYEARTLNGRLAAGLAVAAELVCLVLTWSRGGWLGLILAAAVFLVIMDKRFIVLGVLGLAALAAVMPQSLVARFSSIGSRADSSTNYRVYIWLGSLDMLRDYWLTGFGTGVAAFQHIYPRYAYNAVVAPHAHNLFLQIFCECGAGGILTLLAVFLGAVRELGRTIKNAAARRGRVLPAALTASLAGFALQSMTDHSFYNYRVTLMFWVTVGLCAAVGRVLGGGPESGKEAER